MKSRSLILLVGCLWLALILGCVGAGPPKTQTNCVWSAEHPPDIRGVKLGMNLDQVQKQFPQIKAANPDEFGLIEIYLKNKTFSRPKSSIHPTMVERIKNEWSGDVVDPAQYPQFKGIFGMEIGVLDGKVTSIMVIYPDETLPDEDFRKRVKETYNLPDEVEKSSPVSCNDLEIRTGHLLREINYGTGFFERDVVDWAKSFSVVDKNADAVLQKRKDQKAENKAKAKREEQERKAREFKP